MKVKLSKFRKAGQTSFVHHFKSTKGAVRYCQVGHIEELSAEQGAELLAEFPDMFEVVPEAPAQKKQAVAPENKMVKSSQTKHADGTPKDAQG